MGDFILNSAMKPWEQLASHVDDAVVFLDSHCAECLHWSGGADLLFDGGATSIKEFSSFETGEEDQKKAIFVVSSLMCGKTTTTIQDILGSSKFTTCLLVTTLRITEDSNLFLTKLESEGIMRMDNKNISVDFLYLPMFIAPMFDNFFATPTFDEMYPVQQKDLKDFKLQGSAPPERLSDLHFYMLPQEYQTQIRMIASSFRLCFHNMDCKEEIFAIGVTSNLLSVQLSHLVNQEKKIYSGRNGILFIDRTMDLIGPCSYSNTSLLDQLLSILPGLPAHLNNVSINISSLCATNIEDSEDDAIVYPGSFVPDSEDNQLLSKVYKLSLNEAVFDIQTRLKRAAVEEEIEKNLNNKVTGSAAEYIENIVKLFKGNAGAILYNSALLQLGLATAQMLQDPSYEKLKILSMTEKLILQQLDGSSAAEVVINQITQLVDSHQDLICFEDLCCLLLYSSYAFMKNDIDDICIEKLVKCMHVVLRRTAVEDLPKHFVAAFNVTEAKLASVDLSWNVTRILLNHLSQTKINELNLFKTLHFEMVEPPSYHSLLPQVVGRIFDCDKPDLEPDVRHIATGRKDLLKMGFNMFRKNIPPRPSDYPVLVIYVIGGITATEVAQINKVLESSTSNCKVVIGSNRLISPVDCIDKSFFGKLSDG